MPTMHLLFLGGVVVFSILAVLARDLLRAAISLAFASVFLALVFFRMGASYVGVFELSVVAGLITVLFITAINLTSQKEKDATESRWPKLVFPLFFLAIVAIDFLVMKNLLGRIPGPPPTEPEAGFGQVLWGRRTFDLVGQIGAIFAGVFGVLALFRKRSKHD